MFFVLTSATQNAPEANMGIALSMTLVGKNFTFNSNQSTFSESSVGLLLKRRITVSMFVFLATKRNERLTKKHENI